MVMPQALAIYLIFIVGGLAIAAFDRVTLPTSQSLAVKLIFPRDPVLGTAAQLGIELSVLDGSISTLARLDVYAPESPLLRFPSPRVRIGPNLLSKEKILLQLPCEIERLGYHKVDQVELGAYSRLGFWFRPLTPKIEPIDFRVAPQSKEISERAFSEMIAAQRLLFEGARLQARSRAADQYLTTRKYQYPDSIRHLDQKKTARTGTLMTRVFDSFFSHHVVLALDLGRAMTGRVSGSSKHDFYLSACLHIARNAVRSRDRISFFAFSNSLHALVAKSRTLAPFESLFKGDKTFAPREFESNFELINETVTQVSGQRSIVIVLTDLSRPSIQQSLLETLGPLCRKHIVVVVSLVEKDLRLRERVLNFHPSQLGTNVADFHERYADYMYDYWADEQFRLFRARLSKLGGAALLVSHEDWMTAVDKLYDVLRHSTRA